MRRIKMLVDYKHYKQGQVYEVTKEEYRALREADVLFRKVPQKEVRMMEAGQNKSYKTK